METTENLKSLILDRINNLDISRSELVEKLGYRNISKGIRRLNVFLQTLKAPSRDFMENLYSVLNLTDTERQDAVAASSVLKRTRMRPDPFEMKIGMHFMVCLGYDLKLMRQICGGLYSCQIAYTCFEAPTQIESQTSSAIFHRNVNYGAVAVFSVDEKVPSIIEDIQCLVIAPELGLTIIDGVVNDHNTLSDESLRKLVDSKFPDSVIKKYRHVFIKNHFRPSFFSAYIPSLEYRKLSRLVSSVRALAPALKWARKYPG